MEAFHYKPLQQKTNESFTTWQQVTCAETDLNELPNTAVNELTNVFKAG